MDARKEKAMGVVVDQILDMDNEELDGLMQTIATELRHQPDGKLWTRNSTNQYIIYPKPKRKMP